MPRLKNPSPNIFPNFLTFIIRLNKAQQMKIKLKPKEQIRILCADDTFGIIKKYYSGKIK